MKPFSIAIIAFMFLKSCILVGHAYLIRVYPEISSHYWVVIHVLMLAVLTTALSLYVKRKMIVQANLIQCIIFYLMIVWIPIVMGKLYWHLLYMTFTDFGWLTDIKGMLIFMALESVIMLSVFAIVKPVKIKS